MESLEIIFIISLLFHLIILVIVTYNYFSAPRIGNLKKRELNNPLSILIPVRNEENNIEELLECLKNQNLENYEIIILDDNSTDDTFAIADRLRSQNSNVSLIRGKELPKDWLGKSWACYQLSKAARHDLLLFIDADVRLEKNAISSAMEKVNNHHLGMLSVFPTQITSTFGEKLVVPLMNWLLLTFLPLQFVYKSENVSFAAANGQFILIKKDVYNKIGTHANFKDQVVEDMEMIRRVKREKFKAMTCLGNNRVKAKMYSSFEESFKGFGKNFFPGFNTGRMNFYLLLLIFLLLFLLPFVSIFLLNLNILLILIIMLERTLVSLVSRENITSNIFLHPLQILIMFIIGLYSASRKKKEWKGRLI